MHIQTETVLARVSQQLSLLEKRDGELWLIVSLAGVVGERALAHGDVTPQPVDTTGLDPVGEAWKETNPYRGNPVALKIGSSGFNQNCARCHGADGRGNPEIKKTLPTVRDFSDPTFLATAQTDTIVRSIMAGKGQMPAFGASLSLPKIQSLSGYVQRLGHGQVARP